MTDMTRFQQYLTLADQLLSVSSKEEIAECARLLAINVAHYQSVYGDLTLDATLDTAYSEEPNQAQIDLMASGMETLVGVLGGLASDIGQAKGH